ncbi:NifB/NifX family molybdenum-iron cluster-binding protein [Desulfopila sp. IMCC35008]|uniref:NifB/NifX family molybdenum-iron cluster-binding protein n=1 Tax=Desulfopila sp. IMCC35008 TaxID=2653858 RepID=UPI0013D3DEC1|nr:NifB/NifX family molybdenum-iron cluster-binding protein [Desulfopila sp. IMCC35008]
MKVGVTVWGDRISPVFDAARMLLVVEIRGCESVSRELLPCSPTRIRDFVNLLQEKGIGELICGAISKGPASVVEDSGIRLIPFIAGMVDPVLQVYAQGYTIESYRMPGCCGNNRCGRIDWYRGGRGLVDLREGKRAEE